MAQGLLRPNSRNGLTIATAVLVLAAAYAQTDPMPRYAAWLVVFTIWMVWFVETFVIWLAAADF